MEKAAQAYILEKECMYFLLTTSAKGPRKKWKVNRTDTFLWVSTYFCAFQDRLINVVDLQK